MKPKLIGLSSFDSVLILSTAVISSRYYKSAAFGTSSYFDR